MSADNAAVLARRANLPAYGKLSRVAPGVWTWITLLLFAVTIRLLVAFLLPSAEQDGYSYAEIISRWSANLSAGDLHLSDLFGFWLPLFPFVAAIPNIWIDNPLLAGKILSAMCGATSCLLVFAITKELTRSVPLACLGFALILSSPLHILYSAACMTDVPYSCLVLASLWFVLQRQWVVAAIFGALAEGVRIEAWALIILLPLIQLAYERRISGPALAILLLPPIAWLGICQFATGDPFAFFAKRARYQANYLDFYPARRSFALANIWQDAGYFLLGANRGVVVASIAASAWSIFRAARRHRAPPLAVAATLGYSAALLGFIFLSYVTKRQPVLFPRYGLIFFTLGLPVFMWLIRLSTQPFKPSRLQKLIVAVAFAICLWEAKRQISIISKVLADFRAHRAIAQTLAIVFQNSRDLEQRCFSDDAAVRVLSHLPADRFVRSETASRWAWQNVANFESYLRQQHVAYLVFTRIENSLPARFYSNLGRRGQIDTDNFQLVTVAFSPFAPDVWLYRLRDSDKAP